MSKSIRKLTIAHLPKDLSKPQWFRDWEANEWIYECFTCLHFKVYVPTKREVKKQVKLHRKECLGGWA